MSEIPKAYEPQSVEDKWYDFWLKQGCFTADPARVSAKRPAYSIVIPPPNVTGVLHMGHVLNNTIQDILARKARMDGKEVLWLPGTDHAGIATEGMVDKQIRREEKKSKRDIGREEFLKRVWAWKEKHGDIIIEQLKKLGCSCDWTRQRFTMDEPYVRCVQKVFVELYRKGLIYRGKRMVNWCPATLTALSDEEVDMEPQKGSLYYFKVEVASHPLTPSLSPSGGEGEDRVGGKRDIHATPRTVDSLSPIGGEGQGEGAARKGGPFTDSEGRIWLTIATTRPETIPGDTAIAVNPKDPRYAALIGKHAIRPLPPELPREQKLIPIIADEHIDPEFGTGVLKVTPAHDKADFEIGQRHKLPVVDIMNPNATMNDLAGADLRGLDRFEARTKAVEILKEIGALAKEEPYENKIGISQRARVPIEPRLSEQWFLKYPSVEQAQRCVANDEEVGRESSRAESSNAAGGSSGASPHPKMRFHPQRWAKVYDHWLANIQDWCISRQLWWGHRIPVWSKTIPDGRFDQLGLDHLQLNEHLEDEYNENPTEGGVLEIESLSGSEDKTLFHIHKGDGLSVIVNASTDSADEAKDLEAAGFVQDPDVLDTWFSSWLWPFATMGWTGDKTHDSKNPTLQAFYPTTDLVTAPEIIFFWVARMIMAGYEFMGEMPFRNVYFTGIIRDKIGRKMSKTLGNSPDPLDLIAKYGADAVRFGTMRNAPIGQDVMFDEKDVELGRNFCNKLWNACRFRQMQGSAGVSPAGSSGFQPGDVEGEIDPALLTSDDKWILLKLDQAIREITEAFAEYKFSDATATLYRFFWSEYCDWYVEASKAVLSRPGSGASPSSLNGERAGVRGENKSDASRNPPAPPHPDPLPPASRGGEGIAVGHTTASGGSNAARHANTLAVIDFVLSHTLRLFHPFLPFITEELWHGLGYNQDLPADQGGKTIMSARWPKPFSDDEKAHYGLDEQVLKSVDAKYELVTRGRNLRRESNIAGNKKVKFVLKVKDPVPAQETDVIKLLLNAEALDVDPNFVPTKGTPSTLTDLGELFLPLEGLVDVAAEKARLAKELAKIEAEIEKVTAKLDNPGFVQKVPAHVLDEHRKRLADWQAKRAQVKAALDNLPPV